MKFSAAKVATLLLVCALALLVLAELMGAKGGWAWLKAGAEAAAVGAIADWFAVVVLFRHPMGIKLPHTAIIPRRKDRIADSLANFVHNHFLQPQQLVFKLQQMNVSEQVSQWLLQENQREQLVKQFQSTLLDMIEQLDDKSINKALLDSFTHLAHRWNAASTLDQALDLVTKNNRHQEVLSLGLQKISTLLDQPKVHGFIAQKIDDLLKKDYPKVYWMLDAVNSVENISHSVAQKISQSMLDYLQQVLENPKHAQRQNFSVWLEHYLVQLKTNEQLQNELNAIKNQWVESPVVLEFLASIWQDIKSKISLDLASRTSSLAHYANRSLEALALRLAKDPGLSQSINQYLEKILLQNSAKWSLSLKQHISSTIKAWDNEQLVQELERNVGQDLQFIRINGTLVGAFAGLMFYALSQLWHWLN